ncbi:MAG: hydantoinase/oxoprolinase family protein [bacterium]|nr:hydantoinase/oxoprolinase family protein [bacterium]
MAWRVGVDIGGTFTDVAVIDEATGHTGIAKVSTTPHDFAAGVMEGLQQAINEQGVVPAEVAFVSHATTVVTNALLEAKGARTALVCTSGFRDLLELRRSARADLYDLNQDAPAVLVPRHCRLEVDERIDAQGQVVSALKPSDIDHLIETIHRLDVEAVAVCLLFAFLNDVHEAEIGVRLRAAFPDKPVFLSSEVLPEIREFERLSTTAVCAYVGPILASYLRRLEKAIGDLGFPSLYVMGSSGGVFSVEEGLKMPVMAVESGPAAGVIAAAHLGKQIGNGNLISFDMGGTTAKASLIENGEVETTSEYEVGGQGNVSRWLHGTGHPIRVPVVDLAEVSAGGGSIAWIDPGGALRVGPESAGAAPGPVCYDQGGTRPTVTDADVVLGYLNPSYLLGGRLAINRAAAVAAIKTHLANPLSLDVQAAAAGIVEVVNHSMADALRIVSIERGYDAREFSLVAFGGAGPVHAAALAEALDIREVIIPPIPGGFSALGLVTTDLRRDYSRTYYSTIAAANHKSMSDLFDEMEQAGLTMLAASGIAEAQRELTRSADCRYVKQAYELNVTFADGPLTAASLEQLATTFHARHRQVYGHENPDEAVQIVNLRLTATGHLPVIPFVAGLTDSEQDLPARPVWFAAVGMLTCPVRTRSGLQKSGTAAGPLIIEEVDTTVVVPPAWTAAVDERGFIRLTQAVAQHNAK